MPRSRNSPSAGHERDRRCEDGGRGTDVTGAPTGRDRGQRPDWRPEPQGTWLLIRYEPTDVGARPVPTGEVFWESPDIRVVGGDAFGNPTGGHPVTLEARVSNRGSIDAAPVRVDFAFVDPALGIVPGAPQLIGTAWTSVLAGQSTVVACPGTWTPPKHPTNLHACLIVTCSAPAVHDTPTAPANPVLDRHVAQRNLTVLEASAGETLSLRLGVANLFGRHAHTGVVAAAGWHGADKTPTEPLLVPTLGVLGSARAAARATTVEGARLWTERTALLDVRSRQAPAIETVETVDEVALVRSLRCDKQTPAAWAGARAGVLAPHPDFASLGEDLLLAPGQTATAEVEVEVPRDPKQPWLALHLAQSQEGQLTGGYTILIRAGED